MVNEIPFSENNFDIVTCINFLEYVPEAIIYEVVREIYRVTRKYLFLNIRTDEDLGGSRISTRKDYTWWENVFFEEGFRTQALVHDIVPYGDVSSISGNITLVFEKIGPVLDASILSDDHGDHWGFTGTFVALACQDLTGAKQAAEFDFLEIKTS